MGVLNEDVNRQASGLEKLPAVFQQGVGATRNMVRLQFFADKCPVGPRIDR